ncbi:MAG: hypothetical protein LM549_02600 [Candidatus Competibacter sp.]|nr:hypothetical protein [Candidatus Competibacter sp.]
MTPLLAQLIAAVVVLVTLMVLLLMGYLFWLQRQERAKPNRQSDAQRQQLSGRRARGHL